MEEPYRKDLSHITWDEVFAHQVRRAGLVEEWIAALQLQPGSRVLDIGASPGYVSLVLQRLLYSALHSPPVKSGRRHNTLLPTSAPPRLYLRNHPSRDPRAKIT